MWSSLALPSALSPTPNQNDFRLPIASVPPFHSRETHMNPGSIL
jgi:hypothetical protein